jgi:hypothetical protein
MSEGSSGKADQPGVEYQPGQAGKLDAPQTGDPRHSSHGLPVSPTEYENLKARALYEKTGHGPIGQEDPAAANSKTAPEIGDEMPDGTIYAGLSPDTGEKMFATPRDAPGTYTFNEAAKYAKDLDAHGHHDFHAPSQGELNVLWENRNKGKLAGTFNETGSDPAGWYWSSTPNFINIAWAQRFSDGYQNTKYFRNIDSSLRCVR